MFRVTVLLLSGLVFSSAQACPALRVGSERYLQIQAQELAQQARQAGALALVADTIVLAQVVEQQRHSSQVRVLRRLKGKADDTLWLPTTGNTLEVIGCHPSAHFARTTLHSGGHYVLYLSQQRVLRAGRVERGALDLPLQQELEIALVSGRNGNAVLP